MSILADFVLNESEHPENAASNALLLVLRRSPGARDGLAAFLERLGIGALGSVWIEREATGENGERPDFSVRDQAGVERCIIESKFWAGLTDNQPLGYLSRLGSQGDSGLVFVCPSSRIESLWSELLLRCRAAGIDVAPTPLSDGCCGITSSGQRLAVVAWQSVMKAMLQEVERIGDHAAGADLLQIVGLADRLDRDDFKPILAAALGPEIARSILTYFGLVDAVHEVLLRNGIVPRDGARSAATASWYGKTITIGGVKFWLGLWWKAWANSGATPFWLQLNETDDVQFARGRGALDRLFAVGTLTVVEHDGEVVVPLYPPLGAERSVVISSLVGTIEAVSDELRRNAEMELHGMLSEHP